MAVWSPRRIAIAVLVVALLAVFAPPFVNVNRFQGRIVRNMEQALGRKVTVASVSLRLLPRPGFDLHNLTIADDPAFGAEPMLRADEVAARVRLTSLWRGRLEVASLNLKSGVDISPPSLNLVRTADGRWNIAALLQRTAQTPSAPTAKTRAEERPRFPYIQIDGGRINFKIGQEKKVHVLTDSDFTLWLASEDEWAFHLTTRPVRTDFNLNDTGILRINGRFHRARSLNETPFDVQVSTENAQLGALTILLYGKDRGWRGSFQANARITGTPPSLDVSAQTWVRDFRRYDIPTNSPLALRGQCTAKYSALTEALSAVDCRMPLGSGAIQIRGETQGLISPASYHLSAEAKNVSVQPLVAFAQHTKKDLPADLAATGTVDAAFELRKNPGESATWSGGGHTSEVELSSSVLTPELKLVPLSFAVALPSAAPPAHKGRKNTPPAKPVTVAPLLSFTPFRLALGASTPVDVTAWFGREDYQIRVKGDTWIARMLQVGRALGLSAPGYDVDGTANIDMQIAGNWARFSPPQLAGTAQLHNLVAPMRGLNAPLQVTSASLQLDPALATLQKATLRFTGSPVQFTGSLRLPRNCGGPAECTIAFDLQADQLSMDDMNRLVNPALAKHSWYDFLSSRSANSTLELARASGTLAAKRLVLKTLVAQNLTADLQLQAGILSASNVHADLWGGKYRGTWRADFNPPQPEYSTKGTLSGVGMAQLATLMHDNWATGTVDANYQLTMAGTTASQLASSLTGQAGFTWHNGVFRHVALDAHSAPLQFKSFAGQLELRKGEFDLAPSRILTGNGSYEIKGTASLARQLSLTLQNGAHIYTVSGSLEKPKVVPAAALPATVKAARK